MSSYLTRQSSTDSNYSLCPSISDISMSEDEPNNNTNRRRHLHHRHQQQQQQQQQQQVDDHPSAVAASAAAAAAAPRWRRNSSSSSPPLEYSESSGDDDNNKNRSSSRKSNRNSRSYKKQQQLIEPGASSLFQSVSKFRRRSQQSRIIQYGTLPSDSYVSGDDEDDDDDEEKDDDDDDDDNQADNDDDDDDDQENKQHRRSVMETISKFRPPALPRRHQPPSTEPIAIITTAAVENRPSPKQQPPPSLQQEEEGGEGEPPIANTGYYPSIPSLNQLMSTVAYSFHRATPPAPSAAQRKQSPGNNNNNKALLSLGLEGLSRAQPSSSQSNERLTLSQQQQQQQQQQPSSSSRSPQLPNENSGEVTEYPHYNTTTTSTTTSMPRDSMPQPSSSSSSNRKPVNTSSSTAFPTWSKKTAAGPTNTITPHEKSPLLHRIQQKATITTTTPQSRPNLPMSLSSPSLATGPTKMHLRPPMQQEANSLLLTSGPSSPAPLLKWKKPTPDRPVLFRAPDSSTGRYNQRHPTLLSQRRYQIAACYLSDYELGRPPTLPPSILTLLSLPPQGSQQQHGNNTSTTIEAARTIQSMLQWHAWQYSWIWRQVVALAAFTLLVSSAYETTTTTTTLDSTTDPIFHATLFQQVVRATLLNLGAVVILCMDVWMQRQLRGDGLPSMPIMPSTKTSALSMSDLLAPTLEPPTTTKGSFPALESATVTTSAAWDVDTTVPSNNPPTRVQFSLSQQPLTLPLSIFLAVLALESIQTLIVTILWTKTESPTFSLLPQRPWVASVFKPLVLFYISAKARQALEALLRILPIAIRVVAMELFVILAFSAVACRLFHSFDSFDTLSTAWLSLYELSTTVVNPSLWMPLYQSSKTSALFFIFFVVVSVFYMHSLVLSVVFQIYVQAAADVHERSIADRDYAIRLAYCALQQQQYGSNPNGDSQAETDDEDLDLEEDLKRSSTAGAVDIASVRQTLRLVRPHYSAMKINALVEIVDPSNQQLIDYATFRTKIRQALNASVRTARATTTISLSVELLAGLVAMSNFTYVILLTSSFKAHWFDFITLPAGTLITFLGLLELIVRFNPLRNVTPITRLEGTFDGVALVAAIISAFGVVLFLTGQNNTAALEFILTGRALDMMRIMRFFKMFRDIVRRSADVIPALAGPLILVITALHMFTYLGMALWGGAVQVGQHEGEIEHLYDLNNFNSYEEGMVTMFQILVNNDWHAIAQVFLFANRCSSPYIVYPFFILGQILGGCILLNVVTAFFVESFIAKLNHGAVDGERMSIQRDREDGPGRSFRHLTSLSRRWSEIIRKVDSKEEEEEETLESGDHNEVFEFDVYEREGFDHIMRTVAGGPGAQNEDLALQVCKYLEIFESLAPGRDKVGYLVCCQQTMSRFGNRRFQTIAREYLEDNVLHGVVTDMHTELLVLSSGIRRASFVESEKSLIRTFPHRSQPEKKMMEVSASLLRNHPAVSLFVSRVIRFKPPTVASSMTTLTSKR